jgi:aminoglycoside 3-N-acetyltransferase I
MAGIEPVRIQVLKSGDVPVLEGMLAMFGAAFDEAATYNEARPGSEYLEQLLSSDYFIAVAAVRGDEVLGGLAAYELRKFEQRRSEIYIYDLAVDERYRRRGLATGLIRELKQVAAERGAYVMFVQADSGDDPAIRLYSRLGRREEVLHFDIPVE